MTVADQRPLPLQVLEALDKGRKIEAVKRLREAEGLGLREAKVRVDAYMAAKPGVRRATVERRSGAGRWILLGLALAVVVALLTT